MAFEVTKMGKLADRLESEAYTWCVESIKEHFGLEPGENEYGFENDITEVLTEEHIKEIEEFINSDAWIEGYCQTALNTLCDRWREENDLVLNPFI